MISQKWQNVPHSSGHRSWSLCMEQRTTLSRQSRAYRHAMRFVGSDSTAYEPSWREYMPYW